MEGTFKTKDVANKTGIPANLIRKYSQILEQNGYSIEKSSESRCFKIEDIRLLKTIHGRAGELNEDIAKTIVSVLNELQAPSTHTPVTTEPVASVLTEDVSITIQQQNKKFEEFMTKLDTLAQLNEAIIHQNSTLISQNRQKDEKLDELMQQVYVKETTQEEILHDLVDHVHKNETKQEEKLNDLMSHMYKKEAKQEEKMGKLMNQVYKKEANRDEQLMQLIREMQETKRMIAASQDHTLLKSIKSIFVRVKSQKAES